MGHGFVSSYDKMFSVREAPWHFNETQDKVTVISPEEYAEWLADGTLRKRAMVASGHDFTVVERPLLVADSTSLDNVEQAAYAGGFGSLIKGYKALVREDTNEVFNLVGDGYQVFQNEQLWDLVEAIIDQPNVKWETGGTIRDGKVVWVLALVDEPFTIKGDDSPVLPYIIATASHDGTVGITVRNTNIRVVCWNTLDASEGEAERTGREFSFRHTKNLADRIETARLVLAGSKDTSLRFRELAEELAAVPFGEKAWEKFLVEFIPEPAGMVVTDRVRGNIEEARAKVRHIMESKSVPEDHKFTGYGALQTGIEYLDHLRGYRNHSTYLGRTLIKPDGLKDRLLPLIKECSEYEQANKVVVG
jgi:phage/plasmid-like protein (TIGR03299 family)